MPDYQEIAAHSLPHAESLCRELFPFGKRRGAEYLIGDIYGNAGESLSINVNTGRWADFSDGSERGGDVISLVAAAKGMSQYEAAEWLADKYALGSHLSNGHANGAGIAKPPKQPEFVPIFPMAEYPTAAQMRHPTLGNPSVTYPYHDFNSGVINVICRFETTEGKEFRALTYGTLKGREAWHWKQLPAPRPLYDLDALPESGQVIIVEGEKAAEALKALISDIKVTTWQAGTQNVDSTDWSPLFNKKYTILLWPDNDLPGHKAMDNIATILKDKVEQVNLLDVSSLPAKSDAADWDKSAYDLKAFLNEKWKKWKPAASGIASGAHPHSDTAAQPSFSLSANGKLDPLALPGLIGDTVRWIVKHAIFPQPELALLNTLAFAASVFGRRWIGPTGTYTNIYTVGIAGTGQGKEHSCRMITNLAEYAGLSQYIGGNSIRSDTGMVRGLSNNSCQLLMLDEFGIWLQGVSNPQAPSFIRDVIRTILTLYGKSGGVYNHGDYADAKATPIIIHNPVLCIYGMSTESEYIPSLKKSAISSGQMGRFVVLPGPLQVMPNHDAPIVAADDDLVAAWQSFKPQTLGGIANSNNIRPEPVVVGIGKCKKIKQDLLDKQTMMTTAKTSTSELWARYWENILRIAAILAISRNAGDPSSEPEHIPQDFEIAQSIVESSLHYMSSLVENNMAETAHEGLHHEILNYLRKHPGGITRSELMRKFQKLKKRDLDELVGAMIEQEVIESVADNSTGGRKRVFYKPIL